MSHSKMFNHDDVFDLAGALYFYLQHNWDGMGDPMYADFCSLSEVYKRGRYESEMNDVESDLYKSFTEDNYRLALARVLSYKSEE